jgi:hypothetical protein
MAGSMRKDAACLAVLVAALFFAPAAHAGTYVVYSCAVPDGGGVNRAWSIETYSSSGRAPADMSNYTRPADPTSCPTPQGVVIGTTVSASQSVKASDGVAWVFHAPAGNLVNALDIYRYGQARSSASGSATYWAAYARAGTTAGGPQLGSVVSTDYCLGNSVAWPGYCQLGAADYPNGPASYANVEQPVVAVGVECVGPTQTTTCLTGDGATPDAGLQFQGARVTVEDNVPPVMDAGSPVDGWHRPSDALTASGNDAGGLKVMHASIDGTEVAAQTFTCDFHLASPCPTNPQLPLPLAGLSDGMHAVTVTGVDVVGSGGRGDRAVSIDGTAPTVNLVPTKGGRTITLSATDALSGVKTGQIEVRTTKIAPFAPLTTSLKSGKLKATVGKGKTPSDYGIRVSATDNAGNVTAGQLTSMTLNTRLNKHLSKVRNASATIPYNRDVVVTGRLTTVDGVPLGGQAISVTSTLRQARAKPTPLRTVTTAPSGRFSFRVQPGPSRKLDITFGGAPDLLHRTRSVTLHVPARSTIQASDTKVSGAASVRFSGRLGLVGAKLPSGGKIVVLEARQRGRWSTVASTRARGAKASWHATAHFRGNPGTYPVRLRIPREAVFPYDIGHSPAVKIRVF